VWAGRRRSEFLFFATSSSFSRRSGETAEDGSTTTSLACPAQQREKRTTTLLTARPDGPPSPSKPSSIIVGTGQLTLLHPLLDLAHVGVVGAPRELATVERPWIEDETAFVDEFVGVESVGKNELRDEGVRRERKWGRRRGTHGSRHRVEAEGVVIVPKDRSDRNG
jgi:hypothetical protein